MSPQLSLYVQVHLKLYLHANICICFTHNCANDFGWLLYKSATLDWFLSGKHGQKSRYSTAHVIPYVQPNNNKCNKRSAPVYIVSYLREHTLPLKLAGP